MPLLSEPWSDRAHAVLLWGGFGALVIGVGYLAYVHVQTSNADAAASAAAAAASNEAGAAQSVIAQQLVEGSIYKDTTNGSTTATTTPLPAVHSYAAGTSVDGVLIAAPYHTGP